MPHSILSIREVAAVLGLDHRSVERLAEAGQLKARKSRGKWLFREAEVSDWMAQNLAAIQNRPVAPNEAAAGRDLLLPAAIQITTVAIPIHATSRPSVLRKLVELAEQSGRILDPRALLESLVERERQHPTVFPQGVAIPHPTKIGTFVNDQPVVAACRLHHGIPFGDRTGTLTDLFFLVCCTSYPQHLMHLGRLCRVLAGPDVLERLRLAGDAEEFISAIEREEQNICRTAR